MDHRKIGAVTLLESLMLSAIEDAYGEEVEILQEPEEGADGTAVTLVRLPNGQVFEVKVRLVDNGG